MASGIARAAARELRIADAALKEHKKACLACHRAGAGAAASCAAGQDLAGYAELMRRQAQLLHSPPSPEMAQDTLW